MKLQICMLFLFLFLISKTGTITGCHDYERTALLNFKSQLTDPSNRLWSWQGQNCCTWQGINCSSDTFHVIAVDLRNPNPYHPLINSNSDIVYSNSKSTALNGSISPFLFFLTHITYLDLSFNNFMFSRLPLGLSNLSSLTYLNLSNAVFRDSVSFQLANLTFLEYLDLSCSSPLPDFSSVSFDLSSETVVQAGAGYDYIKNSYFLSPNLDWLKSLSNLRVLRLTGFDLYEASVSSRWASPISALSNLRLLRLSNCKIIGKLPVDQLLNLTHLSVLEMDFNPLTSYIPVQLANLSSLSVLDLTSTNVEGSIPYVPQMVELYLGNSNLTIDLNFMFDIPWPRLEILNIRYTQVIGSVPDSIANTSSLVSLVASSCLIEGSIPSSLANLSRIESLYLDFNHIVGQLPTSLTTMKSLGLLSLIQNNIQGSIPISICNMSSLWYLALAGNHLSGKLPDCFGRLPNLQVLFVSLNSLTGTVQTLTSLSKSSRPNIIGLSFNNITVKLDNQKPLPPSFQPVTLDLSSCNIQGNIPNFLYNLTKLRYLSLAYNKLSGSIPSWLFNLPNLGYLDLSFNSLQGSLPPFIKLNSFYGPTTLNLAENFLQGLIPSQLDNVDVINLSGNNFTDHIPEQLGLGKVRHFSLSNNRISGPIPSSFCHVSSVLMVLDLSNNSFSGSLPNSLGNCKSLAFLNLAYNNFSSLVPKELENAKGLSFLDLTGNHFEGHFPNFIQNLINLEVLEMGYNKFSGKIPGFIGELQNLRILVLKSNFFNGLIPEGINKLGKLQIMDFSINKLSGPIPDKLDGLKTLRIRPTDGEILGYVVSFMYSGVELSMSYKGFLYKFEVLRTFHSGIDLSLNNLTGKIPQGITLLKGLASLNLSHNALSGEIPSNIGDMKGLESIDIRFNKLFGSIPASINLLDSLGFMNLSYNNLSGKIPAGTRFDTLYGDGSTYSGNQHLCAINCNDNSSSSVQQQNPSEKDAADLILFIGIVMIGYGIGFWGYFGVLYLLKEQNRERYWNTIDKIASKVMNCS